MKRYTCTIYIEFESKKDFTNEEAHDIAEHYFTTGRTTSECENFQYWKDSVDKRELK